MKPILIGFAWLLIYTTPLQVAFLGWIIRDLVTTDYTVLTLTGDIFFTEHLKFFHDWLYSWFWNDFLEFIWSLPIVIISGLKFVFNTWLGFWLLPVARSMA